MLSTAAARIVVPDATCTSKKPSVASTDICDSKLERAKNRVRAATESANGGQFAARVLQRYETTRRSIRVRATLLAMASAAPPSAGGWCDAQVPQRALVDLVAAAAAEEESFYFEDIPLLPGGPTVRDFATLRRSADGGSAVTGSTDKTGLVDWSSSRLLATVLARIANPFVDGRSVVEFGCGTGLLAASALQLGASFVAATDASADTVVVAQRNCRAQCGDVTAERIADAEPSAAGSTRAAAASACGDRAAASSCGGRYCGHVLRWGAAADEAAVLRNHGHLDIGVASEVFYIFKVRGAGCCNAWAGLRSLHCISAPHGVRQSRILGGGGTFTQCCSAALVPNCFAEYRHDDRIAGAGPASMR